MHIVRSPIAVGFDDDGNKIILDVDTEVTVDELPSEKAFDRLVEVGAIEEIKGKKVTKTPVKDAADKKSEIPEGKKPLTKLECVKLILADEVNSNGLNDEELDEKELMKLTAAVLNSMVDKINAAKDADEEE